MEEKRSIGLLLLLVIFVSLFGLVLVISKLAVFNTAPQEPAVTQGHIQVRVVPPDSSGAASGALFVTVTNSNKR